ncbi:AsmA family protein [bacterium]|nr:AsmA family protein [bacterium]
MRKKKLKILLFLPLLFLVGIIVLMNITISAPKLRDMAVAQLEKALGRQVTIEELRVNLWRGVEIRELSIGNHKDFQPGPFVQGEKFIVRYKLLPLLRRKLVIGEVSLINPRILIERDQKGSWNFSDLLEGKPPTPKARPSARKISLLVSSIIITGGKVNLLDRKISHPPTKTGLENLELMVSGFSLTSPFQFNLTGTLVGGEATKLSLKGRLNLPSISSLDASLLINNIVLSHYGPYLQEYVLLEDLTGKSNLNLNCRIDKEKHLNLTGKMAVEGVGLKFLGQPGVKKLPLERLDNVDASIEINLIGKISHPLKISQLEGSLDIDQGKVKLTSTPEPIEFNNFDTHLSLLDKEVKLRDIRCNLYQGNLKGEGYLNFSRLAYSFKSDLKNFDVGSFLSSVGASNDMISGRLECQASIEGDGFSPEAASGRGELKIKEGKLIGMPIMRLLAILLDAPFLGEIEFEEIFSDFAIENKIVKTDNVRLISKDVDIFARGSFDFDTNLNYELTIRFSPELSAKSFLKAEYLQDEEGRTIIRAKVGGTFEHPETDILKAQIKRIIEKKIKKEFEKGIEDLLKGIFE